MRLAAKPRGAAYLDDPYLLSPPIMYFDNPMTGFLNCTKKLPAIKTKLSDAALAQLWRREEIERNVNDNCGLCCRPLMIKFEEFTHLPTKHYQALQV